MAAVSLLHLSRYLRLFRVGPTTFVESILVEQSIEADALMLAVLRILERTPISYPNLLEEAAHTTGATTQQAAMRVGRLHQLKLIHTVPDGDRATLLATLDSDTADFPIVDQVELTNVCPMSCLMCPTGQGILTRRKGYMAEHIFRRVVEEIAATQQNVKPLTLHNLGESLLHQELPHFIRMARDAGLQTELSANPGHMPLEKYRALEDAGLSRLVLDVDGTDPETLEQIRGKGAKGEKAFQNLGDLLEHRRTHPTTSPQVLIQMIKLPHNRHQHDAFRARFDGLGIPGVTAYLKDVDANTDGRGEQVFQIGRRPRSYLCRAPWRTVVVLWDGRVVPCCHDADGRTVLGSLEHQSLREIWHGEPTRQLRARLRDGALEPTEPCSGCAHRPDRFERAPLDEIPEEPLHW